MEKEKLDIDFGYKVNLFCRLKRKRLELLYNILNYIHVAGKS